MAIVFGFIGYLVVGAIAAPFVDEKPMTRPVTGPHLDKSGNSEVTVALQGTLDTFALPDVLRLLASTKKTGRLVIAGNGADGGMVSQGHEPRHIASMDTLVEERHSRSVGGQSFSITAATSHSDRRGGFIL